MSWNYVTTVICDPERDKNNVITHSPSAVYFSSIRCSRENALGPWLPIISVQLESRILFRLDGVFIVSPGLFVILLLLLFFCFVFFLFVCLLLFFFFFFFFLFFFSCSGSFLNMYDFKDQWAFGSDELIMLAWGNVCNKEYRNQNYMVT